MVLFRTDFDHEFLVRYLISRMTNDETPVLAQMAKDRVTTVSSELDGLQAGEQSKSETIRTEAKRRTLKDRLLGGRWFANRSRNRVIEKMKNEEKAERVMFVRMNTADHSAQEK